MRLPCNMFCILLLTRVLIFWMMYSIIKLRLT
nr:MAG TPA: hypothetical protein [Caudoviricetes sp.]